MIVNTLLRDHSWELIVWNDSFGNICMIIGPNSDILNYIREFMSSAYNDQEELINYLNRYEDVPFVIENDIETALLHLDEKLSECEVNKCSWRNRAAERLSAIASIFGYIECI